MCFDLVHPDRPVAWRRYLGAILLSLALLFLLVSFAVVVLAPKIEGIGIVVSDIQLLFELFLLASAALASFSFAWSRRRWLTQSCILFLSIVSARALTFFVPFESICQPQTRRLSEMMFFAREARCIEQPEWMAVALVLLMLWALGTYALYFKLHLVRTVELDLEDG